MNVLIISRPRTLLLSPSKCYHALRHNIESSCSFES